MKKAIFTTITLIVCPMLIVSCGDGNSTSQQNKVNQANTATTTPANSESISANKEKLNNIEVGKRTSNPTSNQKTPIKNNKSNEIPHNNPILGTIKDMQNGDLKCYVTVVDEKGKLYEGVGATFEVCEPEKYVNKKVKMSYGLENVSDCQSSEPCGKTIEEWLITNIEIQK
ncbi:hypothetical protein [Nostoc sp. UHCC 0252]|uniref:hypothetical protein n=1 Tax=Nostoc sp. UHCC 0252 TaxID=3110241 RepID=UPI002B2067B2|nr:hypothetical protein [Nostoc sp. UHCC 0252]MEA5603014.1 hypothetical protein [Nostoc sp. UHCC 0252]